MLRKSMTFILGMIAIAGFAFGQQTPVATPAAPASPATRRPSPGGTAATQVGGSWSAPDKNGETRYQNGKWIEIEYSRPILRGRTSIFGSGADYGKKVTDGAPVWRAGANTTTLLKTEVPLVFGSKTLPAGVYSLFVDLKASGWTLIVSNQPYQEKYDANEKMKTFGAYNYDPKYDLVRVPMTMINLNSSHEQFTIGFVDMTDKGGKIAMAWEKTGATVPFSVGQ
jgi:Protein of unknown function (DUF2911)